MTPPRAFLIAPTTEQRSAFQEMVEEFQFVGDDRYGSAGHDFPDYFERLEQLSNGENLPPGIVPQYEFWLVADDRIVGRSKLRRQLNPNLEIEGGHIGYDIRPSERRKGYGTLILALTLQKAKGNGLHRVLVTCDEENIGSAKIIRNNGGVLCGKGVSERSGKPILRFWIDL